MKQLSKNILFIFPLFLVVTLAIYWPLFFTFYQQDEWQGVGYMLALGFKGYITSGFSPIQVLFGQSRILTAIINFTLFRVIPYNISLLATYAILLHAINTTLVYFLSFRVFKKLSIALICASFFCLNAVGNQSVIWFGTSVAALSATMLLLLSLIFFFKYLDKENNTFLWTSYLTLIASFYFKESALGFIPLYALLLFLYEKRKVTIPFIVKASLPTIYFICFALFRYISIVFESTKAAGYISSGSPQLSTIIFNGIRSLLVVIGQTIIPQDIAVSLGSKYIPLMYPVLNNITGSQKDLIIQSLGIDIIMIIISLVLLIVLFIFIHKKEELKKVSLFLFIIAASLLPYILISPGWSYFESRYYYVPIIGISLLIGSFASAITELRKKYLSVGFLLIFISLLVLHIKFTYNSLFIQMNLARQRIQILSAIKKDVPRLDKKTVFYITSNNTYIVPNNPLPMQQGIGYTLQVWLFNDSNNRLKPLLVLPDTFLWDLGTQGYRQIGDQGFGYFYNFYDLKKAVQHYKIAPNNIYAFYWNGNSLTNTTKQLREKIKISETAY